jgi:hypothetical protein
MPWGQTEPVKERMRFVADAERGYTLCGNCVSDIGSVGGLATSGSIGTRRTGCQA